jgi:hypothetical protein
MNSSPSENTPVEVEDDYQLGLDIDVDDETSNDSPSNASFIITSYGADYTVDTIISRVKSEAFYVPKFQRNFVWSQRHASRFIEACLCRESFSIRKSPLIDTLLSTASRDYALCSISTRAYSLRRSSG